MFKGNYEHKVDHKGRVAIPQAFRSELGHEIYLTRIGENCITAFTTDEWKKFSDKVASLSYTKSKNRMTDRWLFGNAFELESDSLGRIVLPEPLKKYAQIEDTAIVIGANNRIEIWSKKNWEAEQAMLDKNSEQLLETLDI